MEEDWDEQLLICLCWHHIPTFWIYTTGPCYTSFSLRHANRIFFFITPVTCIISFSWLSSNVTIITDSYSSSHTERTSSMYLFRSVSCIFVHGNETVTLQGTSNPPYHYRRVKSVLVSVIPMKAWMMKSTKEYGSDGHNDFPPLQDFDDEEDL